MFYGILLRRCWRYKYFHTSDFAAYEQIKDEGKFVVLGQVKEDWCFDDFEQFKYDVYFPMFMQVEIICHTIYA